MSKFKTSLGSNTGAALAGGAMLVAFGIGAYLAFGGQDATSVSVHASAPQNPEGQAAEASGQVAQSETPDASEVEPASRTNAPTFDALRREPDGTTIIAGRAAPLSDVKIFVDGEQVGTAKADSSGGFAAIATLPLRGDAQVVSLSAQSGEEVVASVDEIILAPSVLPPVASAAAPLIVTKPNNPEPSNVPQAALETAQMVEPTTAGTDSEATSEPQGGPTTEQPRVAVLKSDATGVSLLGANVTTEVALDTIGYSELGEVQLTGRAQPDTAKVRVYLDNRSVISLPVSGDGRWRGDLPDVDEGVYTLRLDEVNASGAVSSRVETPFKRESAEVLAQASANADGPIKSITVQAGATLWAIARDRYGDGTLYVRVFEANGDSIRNPDLIYPGQVFDLPN